MTLAQRRVRITSEHNGDGTHNAAAQDTLNITVEHNSDGTHTSGLSAYYESAEQTITAAGSLQLTHNLGAEPLLIQCYLICKTAEANYSIDDKLLIQPYFFTSQPRGMSIVPDATYINIRYSIHSSMTDVANKTTGANFTIINANWKLIVRAWA